MGLNTIEKVHGLLNRNPKCYELIFAREDKVEKEYKRKAYEKSGGSKLLYKKHKYTGFKRKDVKR